MLFWDSVARGASCGGEKVPQHPTVGGEGMTKSKHIPGAAKNRGGLSAGLPLVCFGRALEAHATYPRNSLDAAAAGATEERRGSLPPLRVLRRKGEKQFRRATLPAQNRERGDRP